VPLEENRFASDRFALVDRPLHKRLAIFPIVRHGDDDDSSRLHHANQFMHRRFVAAIGNVFEDGHAIRGVE